MTQIFLPSILDSPHISSPLIQTLSKTHYKFLDIEYENFGWDLQEYFYISQLLFNKPKELLKSIKNQDINRYNHNFAYMLALIPVYANAGLSNVSISLPNQLSEKISNTLLAGINDIAKEYEFQLTIKNDIWYMQANWLIPFKTYNPVICMKNGAKDYLIESFNKEIYSSEECYKKATDCVLKIKKILNDIQITWFSLNQNNHINMLWPACFNQNLDINASKMSMFKHNSIINHEINQNISPIKICEEFDINFNLKENENSNLKINSIFFDDFLIDYSLNNSTNINIINLLNHINNCCNNIISINTYIMSSTRKSRLLIFKPKKWYHLFKS